MAQLSVFPSDFTPQQLQTRVIARRKDFDALFDGFTSMRAISYVASVDLLVDLLKTGRFQKIELVLGESLVGRALEQQLRKELTQKSLSVVDELAGYVERGGLHIFVPSKVIHTKFYLLISDETVRVITTSANLTLTA